MKQDAWEGEDPLATMKGVVRGMTIGAILWAVILTIAWKIGLMPGP